MQADQYVVVRTYSAGVHAGELVSQNGKEVTLKNARRIWYWRGANTLHEIGAGDFGSLGVFSPSRPVGITSGCQGYVMGTSRSLGVRHVRDRAQLLRWIREVRWYARDSGNVTSRRRAFVANSNAAATLQRMGGLGSRW